MRFINVLKFINKISKSSLRNFTRTSPCYKGNDYIIDLEPQGLCVEKIYKIVEESGIPSKDKRIEEFTRSVNSISKGSTIDRDDFLSLMDNDKFQLARKIFCGDLCIPNFKSFVEHISDIYSHCLRNHNGEVASFVSRSDGYNPKYWGVSICTVDGQRFNIGDSKVNYCLQSMSKPVTYALALTEIGSQGVHEYVGYEPSGAPSNHIHLNSESRPHNPMINAGAIVICSLIKQGLGLPERFDYIIKEFKNICGHEYIAFNNSMFMSKKSSADRNFALGYYLRENSCFPKTSNLHETLDLYFQMCSLEMNTDSMSVMAGTFANGGLCPTTQEKVLSNEAIRDTLCLMHSCGMYDYSGQFAFKCGLPCKSGVSGGCLIVIPNLMGIGIWSPPLDKQGNSCRSLQFCMELVQRFNFHHFDSLLDHHGKIDPRKKQHNV